jgi:hypothetical protein
MYVQHVGRKEYWSLVKIKTLSILFQIIAVPTAAVKYPNTAV